VAGWGSGGPVIAPGELPASDERRGVSRVLALRRAHPGWGPSRIVWQLEREGVVPLPGRSSVYRALVRHGLVAAKKRRRRREDYRRRPAARPHLRKNVLSTAYPTTPGRSSIQGLNSQPAQCTWQAWPRGPLSRRQIRTVAREGQVRPDVPFRYAYRS
jgi:hypothetical protein